MIQLYLFVLLGIFGRAILQKPDLFRESLSLEPLPNGNLVATFKFDSDHLVNPHSQYRHFLFPKPMKKLLTEYQIQYLQLSMTQGIWDTQRWGLHPNITLEGTSLKMLSSPTGASLWTCSRLLLDDEIWKKFTNTLGALFCASFNLMTPSMIAHPELEYYSNLDPKAIRYAILPRELVCTENLTPWIKLLPCLDHAGLALLLNPTRIYRSLYHSMSICLYRDNDKYHIIMSLVVVLDPTLLGQSISEWSLKSLFQPITDFSCKCSLANTTQILMSFDRVPPSLRNDFKPSTALHTIVHENRIWKYCQINDNTLFSDIGLKITRTTPGHIYELKSPINFERRIVDQGQERGFLWIRIRNNDSIHRYRLNYLDILPWQMRLYMHTWRMTLISNNKSSDNFQKYFSYSPAFPLQRPNVIECSWDMPPNGIVEITLAFDKEHMRFSEYPYDPSRGFDVPGALLSISSTDTEPFDSTSISSSTLLLTIPLSDDTMPFNVITFTCSMWAVFYGPLFNLMYRPFEAIRRDVLK